MRIVTNSELRCFRRCQREHRYAYQLGVRARENAESLRIGTLVHKALEAWWLGMDREVVLATCADGAVDEYEAAKIRVMVRGYDARWSGDMDGYAVRGVEQEFRVQLTNPESGRASHTYEVGGKIDVLLEDGVVEHKTTSQEIGPGSLYWRSLTLDTQVSTYWAAAKALGVNAQRCVYDVIRKPGLKPLKATPENARKYTKDGRLYAAQRDTDETPDEYELRLSEEVAANPDRYYQRGVIVRLEHEIYDAALDTWHLTRTMREAELAQRAPRNPDACQRYGRACPYLDVCCGTASIEDGARFERVENVHQELTAEQAVAE